MATENHTLYLDLDDEITSVIDRIGALEGQDVTVVVPKGAVVTQSVVNLKLLKRAVGRLKKNVVLVARDETAQMLAVRAGFDVKATPSGPLVTAKYAQAVRQTAPATIHEDAESQPVSESEGAFASGESHVELQPQIEHEVEAKQAVGERPRTAVRTPKRSRTLPRVRRQDDSGLPSTVRGRETSRVKALVARISSQRGPQGAGATSRALSHARTTKNREDKKHIQLLPDLPWKKIGVGTSVAIILGFVAFTFLFAKASVSITPKTETATVDFEVTAKEQPDASKQEVLGTLVSLSRESKKTISVTGKKETGEKAIGTLTINNVFSNKTQSFGVNTRLQSESGQVFLLTAQVNVPGATVKQGQAVPGKVSASVVAENFGDEYNIGPATFTFIDLPADQQKGITASSDAPMSGGSKKEVTVLTNEDVTAAKEVAQTELEPTLLSEIKSKLAPDEELLDGASQAAITKTQTSVEVGEEAQQAEIAVTVEVRALVSRPDDIRAAAREELAKNVPDNQELLEAENENVTWSKKAVDFEQKKLIIAVHAEKKAAYRIDTEELRAQLLGKHEDEAQRYVESLPEVSSARVRLSPLWRNNLPGRTSRVEITVNR